MENVAPGRDLERNIQNGQNFKLESKNSSIFIRSAAKHLLQRQVTRWLIRLLRAIHEIFFWCTQVDVAQWTLWSLPTPEVHDSNPVISLLKRIDENENAPRCSL